METLLKTLNEKKQFLIDKSKREGATELGMKLMISSFDAMILCVEGFDPWKPVTEPPPDTRDILLKIRDDGFKYVVGWYNEAEKKYYYPDCDSSVEFGKELIEWREIE